MVRLYYGNINLVKEPEVFDRFFKKMNTQRRNKILRCKNDEDKYRSLLAGILLKYGLEQLGLSYDSLMFSEGLHGKPFIENQEAIHFSISHSGDYVVCVISDSNVGIDIENSKRLLMKQRNASLDKVAKRSFTVEEYALYESSDDKLEMFLKLWTRKESYSKAKGMGLAIDFSKTNVMSEKNIWSDWLLEGYYISVYLDGGLQEITQEKITEDSDREV